ncbi:MAG: DUF952 domain-containing protein [Marinicaulis sp.]|nr:DUF952 domain-containing protein [Marinicaulis sp.]
MASENVTPVFVYRLATQEEWSVAQENGYVPLRPIDEQDGYIHLSIREQLLETAQRHFVGVTDLLALEIPLEVIAGKVKFEMAAKRGALFPHLYDSLATKDVAQVIKLLNDGDKFRWEDAL